MEMLRRNGLAVAGAFLQKDSHKSTYRSRRHKTELDLMVMRQQPLKRVMDCKALAGGYLTTQHKPVVFEVSSGRRKGQWDQGIFS